MMDESEYVKSVEIAIGTLVDKFKNRPYTFYTEQDMHCYLYHKLYGKLSKEYETGGGEKTILLHKEYPTKSKYRKLKEKYKKEKPEDYGYLKKEEEVTNETKYTQPGLGAFDLVVLHPEKPIYIKRKKNNDVDSISEPLIAIEFGLDAETKHLLNDEKKLTDEDNYVGNRYIIHFIRDRDIKKMNKKKKFHKFSGLKDEIKRIKNEGKVNICYVDLVSDEKIISTNLEDKIGG